MNADLRRRAAFWLDRRPAWLSRVQFTLEPEDAQLGEVNVVVVVVALNDSQGLRATLRSLQMQRGVGWRAAVVDLGSLDDTVRVAQRFASQDSRIEIFTVHGAFGPELFGAVVPDSAVHPCCVVEAGLYLADGGLTSLTARIGPTRRIGLFPPAREGWDHGGRRGGKAHRIRRRHDRSARDAASQPAGDRPAPGGLTRDELVPELPPYIRDRRREDPLRHHLAPHPGSVRVVHRVVARPEPADVPSGAIVLVAEAPYHVEELGPLAAELERRGHETRFMRTRLTSPATVAAIAQHTSSLAAFGVDDAKRAAAIVVMNDWAAARPLVEAVNDAGGRSFAKVEGVQDFGDVDTGRERRPYLTAGVVLAQGDNDVEALDRSDVHVVGSSRLERIRLAAPADRREQVLINLNFTWGVMTSARQLWLDSVAEALRQVGVDAVVSRHPAERGPLNGFALCREPFRAAVCRTGVVVSRFSTVPFESLARGVPFVYHNPHGERVGAFHDGGKAFEVTSSSSELADAIGRALETSTSDVRDRSAGFVAAQIDIDPARPAEVRAADVIRGYLEQS